MKERTCRPDVSLLSCQNGRLEQMTSFPFLSFLCKKKRVKKMKSLAKGLMEGRSECR